MYDTQFQAPTIKSSINLCSMFYDYRGRAFIASQDRSQCFDCVTFINELTGAQIAGEWMDEGGDLPFAPIPLNEARRGDLLVFYMPWSTHRWHVAVMSAGESIDDKRACIFGPFFAHAACECWLQGPAWRKHLVAAYRPQTSKREAA